ncbi:MAG: RIP metalloprotease RseP [Sulfurospirillum sp.]|nr:RIP metalloprotease RseP [Sulfurospirillum sp.]
MGILTSIFVLSFLIFFHELGHFLAARFFGVKVEVFSIGFGSKIFKKIYKGTEYCISAIPLGGYVQMKGQDDSDPTKVSLDSDSYNTKKPWQRIIILFAGPFANFLLAFLLYLAIAQIGINTLSPIIGSVAENTPAFTKGLQANDKILIINDQEVKSWDDVSFFIKNSQGSVVFIIQRAKKNLQVVVQPELKIQKSMFGEDISNRIVGITASGNSFVQTYGFFKSFGFAYDKTLEATTVIVTSLQKLIEGVIPAKDLGGIVSIVQVTSQASEAGIVALFALTALISVNLGVLNLLPIPALDGGHIMFNIYEIIAKKSPSEKMLYRMTVTGWIFLLSLMVFTVFNDIFRIMGDL